MFDFVLMKSLCVRENKQNLLLIELFVEMFLRHLKRLHILIKVLLVTLALYAFLILYKRLSDSQKNVSFWTASLFVPPLSDEILDIHRRLNLTNPGYLGAGVKLPENLPEDIQAEVDQSNEKYKFNEFVSRLIPLDRELKDYRTDECRTANYSVNLPKVSIILSFYNEPFTMVMRTIYSILNRSPLDLIEEILLVDDCSDSSKLI